MKKYIFSCVLFIAALVQAANPVVKSVEARQRYPWNGLVDIVVTLKGTADDISHAEWIYKASNGKTGAKIPIETINRNGALAGSGTTWTQRFVWNAANDVGAVKIDDIALTVEAFRDVVQLWENGPYWGECNVGATKPEEYGYYFWWGDTVGYKRNAADNGWVSAKDGTAFSFDGSDCPILSKSNSWLQLAGYIDSTGNLVAAHDAATAHLGADWRMPTDAEIQALISNCTTTWMTSNGVSGRLVTGKGAFASKSIFLPAAGFGYDSALGNAGWGGNYWSSTPHPGYSSAWYLDFVFQWDNFNRCTYARYLGQSVRPVREFAQ